MANIRIITNPFLLEQMAAYMKTTGISESFEQMSLRLKVRKPVILILLLFISFAAIAQVSASMRAGYSFKTVDAFVAPSLNLSAHNITISPEMMVMTKDNAPVYFGVRLSYQWKFIEAGAGRYFALFSTDTYDSKYVNGWVNSVFIAAHYKLFFLQYDYLDGNKISIGIKEQISNILP